MSSVEQPARARSTGEEVPPLPAGDRNENPTGMSLWALLREDLRTNDGDLFSQGFWAIAVHRFGNWRMSVRPRPMRFPFTLLYRVLRKLVQWSCGIKLDYTVKLGRRLKIEHFGGIVVGARAIGDDVVIRQNTTLGILRRDCPNGKPTLEDRVEVGAGACLLGNITIGHDSIVGANAVVLKDVPPNALAVGVPARVIVREPCPISEIPTAQVQDCNATFTQVARSAAAQAGIPESSH